MNHPADDLINSLTIHEIWSIPSFGLKGDVIKFEGFDLSEPLFFHRPTRIKQKVLHITIRNISGSLVRVIIIPTIGKTIIILHGTPRRLSQLTLAELSRLEGHTFMVEQGHEGYKRYTPETAPPQVLRLIS